MLLFILAFLTLYGGLNAYVYFTIVSGLGYHSWLVALVLGILVLSPIILRFAENRAPRMALTTIAWVGYNWMGISFLFSSIAVLIDLSQLFLADLGQGDALFIVVTLTLSASIYGFIESRRIRIRRLTVRSPKLEYDRDNPGRDYENRAT
jgi:surface polysaccharide O-acyltransferase-like enzyme